MYFSWVWLVVIPEIAAIMLAWRWFTHPEHRAERMALFSKKVRFIRARGASKRKLPDTRVCEKCYMGRLSSLAAIKDPGGL